jgi:micrococcal nuclease
MDEISFLKETNLYNYKATLVKIVDADTIEVDIQLGFYINFRAKIRLAGINAPEKNTEDGKEAIKWLTNYVPLGHEITLSVYRWLATVTYNGNNVNQELVKSGHAVEYWGGKRQ